MLLQCPIYVKQQWMCREPRGLHPIKLGVTSSSLSLLLPLPPHLPLFPSFRYLQHLFQKLLDRFFQRLLVDIFCLLTGL